MASFSGSLASPPGPDLVMLGMPCFLSPCLSVDPTRLGERRRGSGLFCAPLEHPRLSKNVRISWWNRKLGFIRSFFHNIYWALLGVHRRAKDSKVKRPWFQGSYNQVCGQCWAATWEDASEGKGKWSNGAAARAEHGEQRLQKGLVVLQVCSQLSIIWELVENYETLGVGSAIYFIKSCGFWHTL